jgi:GT2 family glycosyltransferase
MVNYNGAPYLETSLGSVYAQKEKFAEILLIDNASADHGLEIVRWRFPGVRILRLECNRGPAAARNVGFKAATADRILFIDNDVSLAAHCPERLINALDEHPRAAVAMARVLYAHQQGMIQYDGAESHFLGLMTLQNTNKLCADATEQTKRIGSVVTACFLIDRRRWGECDPFDETFFFNYEDHDFGLRTRILGHDILAVPAAHAYHQEGTPGLSWRQGGEYAPARVFYLIRNRWQVIVKNYALKTLLLLMPLFCVYELCQLMGVIKKGWLPAWWRAASWMLVNTAQVLRKRAAVQKARKVADREILSGGPIPFTGDLTKSTCEQLGKNALDLLATLYWRAIAPVI